MENKDTVKKLINLILENKSVLEIRNSFENLKATAYSKEACEIDFDVPNEFYYFVKYWVEKDLFAKFGVIAEIGNLTISLTTKGYYGVTIYLTPKEIVID